MERKLLKSLCKILAVIMVLSSVTIIASAFSGEKVGYYQSEVITVNEFDGIISANVGEEIEAKPFLADTTDADTPYYFYDQLDEAQQVIYSEFLSAGVAETFTTSVVFYGEGATQDEALNATKAAASWDIIAAFTAATEDNPYYYWVNGFAYSFSYYTYTTDTGYLVETTNFTIKINLDTNSYTDFADVETKLVEMYNKVQAVEINGITRYEKVKAIHDYICEINEYPEQQGTFSDGSPWYGPMAHQPTGVFLKGLAVCEGYAEAFKLLCDREGIPCITVLGYAGGGHKWNYVKMDDGKWYLVDATWNDQSSLVFNDYLLSGTNTMTPHFESETIDSEVHIPEGTMYTNGFAVTYPALSTDSYGDVMLNYNSGDITVDKQLGVIFVGKDITTLQSKFTSPSDFTLSITSFTDLTGGRLTVTKTSTSAKTVYVFAKRGDINGSNTITVDDYNAIIVASACGTRPAVGSAEFYAGDLNHDGAIDTYDALMLDLYRNGKYDFN